MYYISSSQPYKIGIVIDEKPEAQRAEVAARVTQLTQQ